MVISMARGQSTHPETDALIISTEEGAKPWHGSASRWLSKGYPYLIGETTGFTSADLPEWDSHPSIIKETRLRPDIVIHSSSTQQLIMVEISFH